MARETDGRFLSKLSRDFHVNAWKDKSEWDFEKKHDCYNFVERADLRALRGEQVKSFEGLMTANRLFENGVEHEHEPDCGHKVSGDGYRDRCPDFMLKRAACTSNILCVQEENGQWCIRVCNRIIRGWLRDDRLRMESQECPMPTGQTAPCFTVTIRPSCGRSGGHRRRGSVLCGLLVLIGGHPTDGGGCPSAQRGGNDNR